MNLNYGDWIKNEYHSINRVGIELIKLKALLNLPKGTEYFLSDVHGEYEQFQHILKNASGNIKQKLSLLFSNRYEEEYITELATLIYYPSEKIELIRHDISKEELGKWYRKVFSDLVDMVIFCSKKYTQSKVKRLLPKDYSFLIEELIYRTDDYGERSEYYDSTLRNMIDFKIIDDFLISLCCLIQKLVVDHLHIVGDIYDRGPEPDKIVDKLMDQDSVDIQWGNHDVLWMAGFNGSKACIANLVRISVRYNNLSVLEDSYGINLRPLFNLAESNYESAVAFYPKGNDSINLHEKMQLSKIHQAISIIQFKLEGQIIKRRPEFQMDNRLLLDKINHQNQTIEIENNVYPLVNPCFQLVNEEEPFQLTEEEQLVIDHLLISIRNSDKMKKHMAFLFEKGSMYLVYNNNLLFHGCIPMNKDGTFMEMEIDHKSYCGKELLDQFEGKLRESTRQIDAVESYANDLSWYLWSGKCSPLFGKEEMKTFERYFIDVKSTWSEKKNPYYLLRDDISICDKILEEFCLDARKGHIINGHTPVKVKNGENPIKAKGKMIVIDGGFSKAYHKKTGIAGYTLVYNSYGMELVAHQAFSSIEDAIVNGTDIVSTRRIVDRDMTRMKISETTIGKSIMNQLSDLYEIYEKLKEGE